MTRRRTADLLVSAGGADASSTSWPRTSGPRSPAWDPPARVHRVVVAVTGPRKGRGMSANGPVHLPPGPAGPMIEQESCVASTR
jgi:hypothetical protein